MRQGNVFRSVCQSVQGVSLSRGDLCPEGGLCSEGVFLSTGGSLSGGGLLPEGCLFPEVGLFPERVCIGRPPESEKQAVRIPLECFLLLIVRN